MGLPNIQPSLQRLITGVTASPKRVTAERLAKHFRIPVEALYDERLATAVYRERIEGLPPLDATTAWALEQHAPTGGGQALVAQEVSQRYNIITPVTIDWEHLMHRPLEPEFQTTMPDSSMAPEVPRGARIIFVTGVEPEPGDFVLLRDRDANLYVREYRQVKPGQWEAHAINPAFLPMDSVRDELRVLAVFDGMRSRRSQR